MQYFRNVRPESVYLHAPIQTFPEQGTLVIQEFKDFINRGNVIDLAVAVVLAAAFTPIVNAIVDRVIMPLIGLIFGKPNFDTIGTFACVPAADGAEGAIVVGGQACSGSIGAVITALISFLLVALAVFLVVKAYNRMQGPKQTPAEAEEIVLLRDIRDSLSAR